MAVACWQPVGRHRAGGVRGPLIVILRESCWYDQQFGTYPGAGSILVQNGVPTVRVNDPKTNPCVEPYDAPQDVKAAGAHTASSATTDDQGGQMEHSDCRQIPCGRQRWPVPAVSWIM